MKGPCRHYKAVSRRPSRQAGPSPATVKGHRRDRTEPRNRAVPRFGRPIKRMKRQIVSVPLYKVLIRAACLMMMPLTKGTKVIKGCRVFATRGRPALARQTTKRYAATALRRHATIVRRPTARRPPISQRVALTSRWSEGKEHGRADTNLKGQLKVKRANSSPSGNNKSAGGPRPPRAPPRFDIKGEPAVPYKSPNETNPWLVALTPGEAARSPFELAACVRRGPQYRETGGLRLISVGCGRTRPLMNIQQTSARAHSDTT
ncbi:unnamed protein product, partial [Iphiclides podalirius]